MNTHKSRKNYIRATLWIESLGALDENRALLKKAFAASLMLHMVMFFLVIPVSCTKDHTAVNEDKDEIRMYAKAPGDHRQRFASKAVPKGAMQAQSPTAAEYEWKDEASYDTDAFRNPYPEDFNTEEYKTINENPFLEVTKNPLSTFSIDVDTASYSNIRRFLEQGQMPPADAVRIEEMINYFDYDYPQPKNDHPFSITAEIGECPWNKDHQLALIGLKGKELSDDDQKPSNLVFLIDVSGSMTDENKLPLLKKAFKLLADNLDEEDTVAIVVYASQEGLALPATSAKNKRKIIAAIESLESGGCTAGAAGIQLAYSIAEKNFLKDGNNRIILATDGDFNVGVSDTSQLVKMIEAKRKKGIYLTILGFGMGNYKDGRMEEIADKGNGNYYYIDNLMEGKKVLANQITSTLFTIAKDVKIQVEFNPVKVKAYRLIGYENRMLRKEDFKDDKKDAGELGAGHTVTALYEIVPAGEDIDLPDVDDLKYQKVIIDENSSETDEMLTVKFRYKPPKSDTSIEIVNPVKGEAVSFDNASENFRFAAAVAGFGMMLRNSEHKGKTSYGWIYSAAKSAMGDDEYGYRAEFLKLVKAAKQMDSRQR